MKVNSLVATTLLNTLTMFIIGFCICDKGITQFFCSINKKSCNLFFSFSFFSAEVVSSFLLLYFWFVNRLYYVLLHAQKIFMEFWRYQNFDSAITTDSSWTIFSSKRDNQRYQFQRRKSLLCAREHIFKLSNIIAVYKNCLCKM